MPKKKEQLQRVVIGETTFIFEPEISAGSIKISMSAAKGLLPKAKKLARFDARHKFLATQINRLKEIFKALAREHAGFRGVALPQQQQKILVTTKKYITWLEDALIKLLGKNFESLVKKQVVLTITVGSQTAKAEEVMACLKEFLVKEKGLNPEEFAGMIKQETAVTPKDATEIARIAHQQNVLIASLQQIEEKVDVSVGKL